RENLDFYTGVLGMHLVKKSVNQDAPDTYHLFYADAAGHPGTDLTFFPFQNSPPGRLGVGLGAEIALAIPSGSLEYWRARLTTHGAKVSGTEERRGERALLFDDPHGQHLALVETADRREAEAWDRSPVPTDRQIVGLHAVRLWERDRAPTAAFVTEVLEFTDFGESDGWHRYGTCKGGSGEHFAVRERLARAHRRPTEVIDRFWFQSVYFLEPGGVLFELATEGPGFAVDEDPQKLGEQLVLPPWLEEQRGQIEAALPPLGAATARE